MPLLNVAAAVDCTEVEGPGRRFALWVQGCEKRCPGCCNQEFLPIAPASLVEADEVFDRIARAQEELSIEGVTFLGGEPMLQARGLAHLARRCRAEGLSVMVFTGYTMAELERRALSGSRDLLAQVDLLVDGPYMAERPEPSRNWAGSANQRFHFLTNRYVPGIEHDPAFRRNLELRIGTGGDLYVNGWPVEIQAGGPATAARTADHGSGGWSSGAPRARFP